MLPKDSSERVKLDVEKAKEWISKGAKPSDRISIFLSNLGVLDKPLITENKKHLPKKKAQERLAAAKEKEETAKAEEANLLKNQKQKKQNLLKNQKQKKQNLLKGQKQKKQNLLKNQKQKKQNLLKNQSRRSKTCWRTKSRRSKTWIKNCFVLSNKDIVLVGQFGSPMV